MRCEHWIDANYLRISLAVQGTGKSVVEAAANAGARRRGAAVLFIEKDAERDMKRAKTDPTHIVDKFFNFRLVANGGIWVRSACPRLERILPALSMNVKQPLGLSVIGLKVVVFERPCGRHATRMRNFAEISLAKTKKRAAIDLRIPADVVVQRGPEGVA